MSLLNAIILGLVQGLTEFLPISSSGHLVLLQWQLGMKEPQLSFNIMLHVGTLTAVIVCYRVEVLKLLKALLSLILPKAVRVEARWRKMLGFIILSSLPTFVLGYFIGEKLEWIFASPPFVASMLIVTGTLLRLTGLKRVAGRTGKNIEGFTAMDSIIVGTVQGIAVLPGISRSGATISSGLLLGFEREEAVRYSFLMAIPATLAAALWSAKGGASLPAGEWPAYAAGTLVAFLVGYIALRKLIRIVMTGRVHLFGYYCWSVGALVVALLLLRG